MRLPDLTGLRSRMCSQLALFALLSASCTLLEAAWRCEALPDGLWQCSSTVQPETLSPDGADSATDLTDTRTDTLVAPAPAITGTPDLAPEPEPAPEPAPAQAQEPPQPPASTDADARMQEPATDPAAADPDATAADSYLIPQAKKLVRSSKQATENARWALCPPLPQTPADMLASSSNEIDLQADSAQASNDSVYTLEGNAVVLYGPQRLEANSITYRQEENELTAEGEIRFMAPGLIINGEDATLYPDVEQGSLKNITYSLTDTHGRGSADTLNLTDRNHQQLTQATYTTCPPENHDWLLSAKEVDLDRAEGTGIARNAKLAFKGVPFIYTPYISFPIDDRRRSGLLVPKIGQTEETGADISMPYYWNIAPDKDATITPRYMSDRGLMMAGEFRYLNAHNEGTLSAEYLPSDDRFNNEDRSLVAIEHYGNPWPRVETSVVATNVSDDRYFEDLGKTLISSSQTNLERTAEAAYHGTWWGLGMKVQDYQTVDPELTRADKPYKQLPQIVFDAAPQSRLLGLKFSTHAEANYFTHSDGNIVKGTRVDVQPRVSLPMRKTAWYLDPAVSLRHTSYNLDNASADEDDNASRTTPVVSLDAGTFFERSSHWGQTNFVQTLEPRLFYLYVPDKNQDDIPVFDTGDYDFNFWTLFRENRFSGPDRMGDANQLAVALTTRILDPDNGVQRFSASLGSLFYFRDREVTLPGEPVDTDDSSNIVGEAVLNLARNWRVKSELQWNPHSSSTARSGQHLQYRAGPRKLINLSYRYRDGIQEQTDISFLWPLSQSWHMVGRWYYSLNDSTTIETLGGLGYESCCWGAQIVGRSFINDDSGSRNNAVFFQLELKGLGKLGKKVDSALEHGILGYESSY